MICYNYHPESGHYVGSQEADESPLEPGKFLIPANATFVAPPAPEDGKVSVWSGISWVAQAIPQPPAPEPEPEPEPETPISWDDVRNKRNGLLFQSDWTQLPDVTLSSEQVTAWREYRQQLREVTSSASSPENVIWPTAP